MYLKVKSRLERRSTLHEVDFFELLKIEPYDSRQIDVDLLGALLLANQHLVFVP